MLLVGAVALVASGVGLGASVRPATTPQACIEAMDKLEQVLELSKQMPLVAEAALRDQALGSSYLAGDGQARLNELKDRLEGTQPELKATSAKCRDAG